MAARCWEERGRVAPKPRKKQRLFWVGGRQLVNYHAVNQISGRNPENRKTGEPGRQGALWAAPRQATRRRGGKLFIRRPTLSLLPPAVLRNPVNTRGLLAKGSVRFALSLRRLKRALTALAHPPQIL